MPFIILSLILTVIGVIVCMLGLSPLSFTLLVPGFVIIAGAIVCFVIGAIFMRPKPPTFPPSLWS